MMKYVIAVLGSMLVGAISGTICGLVVAEFGAGLVARCVVAGVVGFTVTLYAQIKLAPILY